jgi:hypothetical protein
MQYIISTEEFLCGKICAFQSEKPVPKWHKTMIKVFKETIEEVIFPFFFNLYFPFL